MIWPVSSARVMNWPGCIMPHCGCGQRISASKPGELPGVEGHDRLVDEGEGGVGHRLLERLLDLPPPDQAGAQHRLVAAPLPLARRLGRVQRQVRVPEQLVGVGAVLGGGHADGDGGESPSPQASANGSLKASTTRSAAASTAAVSAALPMSSANSSPPSRAAVSELADQGGQPRRRGHQQLVADAVAHRVVDDLEVVQVDEQHAGQSCPSALAAATCCAIRSWNSSRLGSPVSASWKAWCFSSSSSLCCSVTSRRVNTRPGDGRVGPQVAAPGLDVDDPAVAAGDLPVHDARAEPRALAQPHEGAARSRRARSSATRSHRYVALHGDVAEDGRGRGRGVLDRPVVGRRSRWRPRRPAPGRGSRPRCAGGSPPARSMMLSSVRATWCARMSRVADRSARMRCSPNTAIRPIERVARRAGP